MSIFKFVNSKVLFKDVRHRPYGSISTPVMVHISECVAARCLLAAFGAGSLFLHNVPGW
jgi:hypothetical protein